MTDIINERHKKYTQNIEQELEIQADTPPNLFNSKLNTLNIKQSIEKHLKNVIKSAKNKYKNDPASDFNPCSYEIGLNNQIDCLTQLEIEKIKEFKGNVEVLTGVINFAQNFGDQDEELEKQDNKKEQAKEVEKKEKEIQDKATKQNETNDKLLKKHADSLKENKAKTEAEAKTQAEASEASEASEVNDPLMLIAEEVAGGGVVGEEAKDVKKDFQKIKYQNQTLVKEFKNIVETIQNSQTNIKTHLDAFIDKFTINTSVNTDIKKAEGYKAYIENSIEKYDSLNQYEKLFTENIIKNKDANIGSILMIIQQYIDASSSDKMQGTFTKDYDVFLDYHSKYIANSKNQYNDILTQAISIKQSIISQINTNALDKKNNAEADARHERNVDRGQRGPAGGGVDDIEIDSITIKKEEGNIDEYEKTLKLLASLKILEIKVQKSEGNNGSSDKPTANNNSIYSYINSRFIINKESVDQERTSLNKLEAEYDAEKKFMKDFEVFDLDPNKELTINMNDKFIFIVVVLLIRILVLSIIMYMSDYEIVTSLIGMLSVYIVLYFAFFVSIAVLVNFAQGYKLKLLFGAFDTNGNMLGLALHLLVFLIFAIMIYVIYLNMSKDANDSEDIDTIKNSYKLDLLTGIVFIFTVLTVVLVQN
jgi:hypothetical protein